MSTVMPKSELVRKALEYINERKDTKPLHDLVGDASMRFNLSPKESAYLEDVFKTPDDQQG